MFFSEASFILQAFFLHCLGLGSMVARINAYDESRPGGLPLDLVSRPGPRSWGKLRHMLRALWSLHTWL